MIESWFSSRATNANRGALFAIYQIVFFMAAAGGQLFVNIGEPENFLPFSLAAILLALALVPLSLTRMKAPHIEQAQRISVVTLARESFSGVAGALTGGALISSFYALGPVYAALVGLDVARTSIFMSSAVNQHPKFSTYQHPKVSSWELHNLVVGSIFTMLKSIGIVTCFKDIAVMSNTIQ